MTYYCGGNRRGLIPSLADREVCPRRDTAQTSSSSPPTSGPHWKREPVNIRHRIETSSARRSSCWRPKASATISSPLDSIRRARLLANGATVSSKTDCPALRKSLEAGAQPAFPPSVIVDVKRLACELPSRSDVPLARFTIPELHREVLARGIGPDQRRHLVAVVERRCAATLASSQLDLSARSAICRESRARAGSVCQNVGRDRAGAR